MTDKYKDIPEADDDFMPVEEPETWTIEVLVGLYNRTAGRFEYTLHPSGKTAQISYSNYTLGYNDTKFKYTVSTGDAVMQKRVVKEVVIS